jgi:hypothetical protein
MVTDSSSDAGRGMLAAVTDSVGEGSGGGRLPEVLQELRLGDLPPQLLVQFGQQ